MRWLAVFGLLLIGVPVPANAQSDVAAGLRAAIREAQTHFEDGRFNAAERVARNAVRPLASSVPAERTANARLLQLLGASIRAQAKGSQARLAEAEFAAARAIYEDSDNLDLYIDFVNARVSSTDAGSYAREVDARRPTPYVFERGGSSSLTLSIPLARREEDWRLLQALLAMNQGNYARAVTALDRMPGCLSRAARIRALYHWERFGEVWREAAQGADACLDYRSPELSMVGKSAIRLGLDEGRSLLRRALSADSWSPSTRRLEVASIEREVNLPLASSRALLAAINQSPDDWELWRKAWDDLGREAFADLARAHQAKYPAARFAYALSLIEGGAPGIEDPLMVATNVLSVRPVTAFAELTLLMAAQASDLDKARNAFAILLAQPAPKSRLIELLHFLPQERWRIESRADLIFRAKDLAPPFSGVIFASTRTMGGRMAVRFQEIDSDRYRLLEERDKQLAEQQLFLAEEQNRVGLETAATRNRVQQLGLQFTELSEGLHGLRRDTVAHAATIERLNRVLSGSGGLLQADYQLRRDVDELYRVIDTLNASRQDRSRLPAPPRAVTGFLDWAATYLYWGVNIFGSRFQLSVLPVLARVATALTQ